MEKLTVTTFNGNDYISKKDLLKFLAEISDAVNSFSDRGDPIRAEGANKVISLLLEKIESPQKYWKPSEQEKGALRTAIHVLTEERNFPKAAKQLQNILDAFEGKESRKDWKPSDEQMYALERASTNEYLSAKQFDILVSLYEQLKKLM